MLELLAAVVKCALYAGCLVSAGSALASASLGTRLGEVAQHVAPTIRLAAISVLLTSTANITVLVLRLGGDFSEPVLSAVLDSPPAPAAALQAVGALILFLVAGHRGLTGFLLRIVGASSVLTSFGVNGHAPSVDLFSSIVVTLHVTTAAWWIGALLLLSIACGQLRGSELVGLVRLFSRYAVAVISLLLTAGALLILTLVEFKAENWFTPYAQVLTLKVVIAAVALSLAAYNKFRLTPRLLDSEGPGRALLRQSISFELLVIAGVLISTSLLTTYTSPHA